MSLFSQRDLCRLGAKVETSREPAEIETIRLKVTFKHLRRSQGTAWIEESE
jgi:hypothetical protein